MSMDTFKWFLAIDITLISLALTIVILRLFFLIKKTENILEEARKTVYIANIELPKIIREIEGTIDELKSLSKEAKVIVHGISDTVSSSLVKGHQQSIAGYTAFNLLPQVGKIRNIIGAAVVAYKTVSTIKKFYGFIKNRRKRRR